MKKLFWATAILAVALTLAGCGGVAAQKPFNPSDTPTESVRPTPSATAGATTAPAPTPTANTELNWWSDVDERQDILTLIDTNDTLGFNAEDVKRWATLRVAQRNNRVVIDPAGKPVNALVEVNFGGNPGGDFNAKGCTALVGRCPTGTAKVLLPLKIQGEIVTLSPTAGLGTNGKEVFLVTFEKR